MKEIMIEEETWLRIERNAKKKGVSVTDYVSLLLPLTEKDGK